MLSAEERTGTASGPRAACLLSDVEMVADDGALPVVAPSVVIVVSGEEACRDRHGLSVLLAHNQRVGDVLVQGYSECVAGVARAVGTEHCLHIAGAMPASGQTIVCES